MEKGEVAADKRRRLFNFFPFFRREDKVEEGFRECEYFFLRISFFALKLFPTH